MSKDDDDRLDPFFDIDVDEEEFEFTLDPGYNKGHSFGKGNLGLPFTYNKGTKKETKVKKSALRKRSSKIKCECGADVVYGKGCGTHSDWCPLYKEW